MKTTTNRVMTIKRIYTQEDRAEYPAENKRLHEEAGRIKAEAKANRKAISRIAKIMARAEATGLVVERIAVTDKYDLDEKTMTTTRNDTGEVVIRRAMTSAELQMDFSDLPGEES